MLKSRNNVIRSKLSIGKQYPMVLCVAFTFVIILNSFLTLFGIYDCYTEIDILKTFVITVVVITLMYLFDKLNIKNALLSIAIDILSVLIGIYGVGALLQVFDFNSTDLLIVFISSFVIYFGVYFFFLFTTVKDANDINKKLKRIHDKNQKEEQDNKE